MNTPKQLVRRSLGKGLSLFMAVLVTATIAPQILNVKPVSADDGGYPWADAHALYAAPDYSSSYGYAMPCPAKDTECNNGGSSLQGTVNGVSYGEADLWHYGLRNCTSYAAWKINQVFGATNISGWGNGKDWDTGLYNPQPYPVYAASGHTPQVGELAQWESHTGDSFGHVAYVWNVESNGTADLWEYNQAYDGNFTSTRTTASTSDGTPNHYIHIGSVGGGTTSTLRTIPTSDSHIQLFKISNNALSENWYNPTDGTTGNWAQPAAMPSTPTGTPSVVARSGQQVIDAFVLGSNGHIYETWYNWGNGAWGGWINMGGTVSSDPQAVVTSDGHEQIFATGTNAVQQDWFSPSDGSYGSWASVGLSVNANGSPALVPRSGQNVIDVFVRGGNFQIYEIWYNWNLEQWGGWINMGGSVGSDPQAVATADGHDQVLGTGNNLVKQNWFSPTYGTYGGWVTSAGLTANAVGSPALVPRSGQNVIDEFVRGGDSQVYETWYDWSNGHWGGWIAMGGYTTSDPQTQPTSDGHDQVFGTSNNQVQQNWFSPTYGTSGGWISI